MVAKDGVTEEHKPSTAWAAIAIRRVVHTYEYTLEVRGLPRPRSYSHLLFRPMVAPLPLEGVGVEGRLIVLFSMRSVPEPTEDVKPKDLLRIVSRLLPSMAFCSNELIVGE